LIEDGWDAILDAVRECILEGVRALARDANAVTVAFDGRRCNGLSRLYQ
jgi:hypothetical protein